MPPRKPAKFDSPEQAAFLNLWRTYDRLRILEDQLFEKFELVPQQYNVLRLLELDWRRQMAALPLASAARRRVERRSRQSRTSRQQLRTTERSPSSDQLRGVPTLELAARLVSRAPDITRMLDKLESRGWIERARVAGNRRVVEVRITRSGRDLLEKINSPLQACHAQQLGHLTSSELRSLIRLLEKARRPHEDLASPWRPDEND